MLILETALSNLVAHLGLIFPVLDADGVDDNPNTNPAECQQKYTWIMVMHNRMSQIAWLLYLPNQGLINSSPFEMDLILKF